MVVWPHGVEHSIDILEALSEVEGVEPVSVIREERVNLRAFIKELYGFDAVPYHHLRAKLKHLRRMKGRPTILHIFFTVASPQYSISGAGRFLHVRSEIVHTLKWDLRKRFNPEENNAASHNHIIHVNDTQLETTRQVELSKLRLNKDEIMPRKKFQISLPAHMVMPKKILIKKIHLRDLLVRIWVDGELKSVGVEKTPHFHSLSVGEPEGQRIYRSYLDGKIGVKLQDGHNWVRFKRQFHRLNSHPEAFDENPILVTWASKGSKYVVLDGLHRSVIAKLCGLEYVTAIVYP